MISKNYYFLSALLIIIFSGCSQKAPLSSKKNPIKMYFVPSVEAGKILSDGEKITELLQKKTGYYFKIAVPTSYASVIEAMGTDEADIAWFPPFAYILANRLYGAEVGLTTIRNDLQKYRGQFLVRADSKLNTLQDIEGKVIAYTDAASTSGYVYPSALLKQKGIIPEKSFFAGGHPQAIIAVYNGTADVGCTFWSPQRGDEIHDARMHVLETYPDVIKKIKIIGFTDWIPNDTVTFRKGFPKELKENIIKALIDIAKTKEGKKIFQDTYDIDGFVQSTDSDYDIVRNALKSLNVGEEHFIE